MPTMGTRAERMRAALLKRLSVHERDRTLPTSSRFLFYELEGKDDGYGVLVSKERRGARRPDQDLIDALTNLREAGQVPWDWIVDETRHVESVWRAKTVAEFLKQYVDHGEIVIDPWQWGDVRPFVICESRSLLGVLRHICRRYGVNSTSTNGQCAGFTRTKLAPAFDELDGGQDIHVLYCGDLDIGGGQIEENTRRVLDDACRAKFAWERLMLTEAQVRHHELPCILKTDRRYKGGDGTHEAWECEALSQKLIIEMLEKRLRRLLPKTIEEIEAIDEQERSMIRISKRKN